MRMAPDHLGHEAVAHRRCSEATCLLGHDDLKGEVEEQIAQLSLQRVSVVVVNRADDLVGFLQQVGHQRGRRLGRVPGTVGAE